MQLPIFLKYLFRIRVNCKRTCRARTSTVAFSSLTEPLWDGVHIEQLAPARFHSGRHHRHASFCALPCRTQARATSADTPVSAGTLRGAMFALRPQRKDVRGQLLGLSLNPEPSHSSVRYQLSSTQPLARRFNESEGSPTAGERCRVVSSSTYRKFEGAHPRKGKAKSTEHKAERYWQVRSRSKKMRSCTKELERVDGRSGLRILMCGCPGSSNASMGRQVSTRPPSSEYGTDYAPESQG